MDSRLYDFCNRSAQHRKPHWPPTSGQSHRSHHDANDANDANDADNDRGFQFQFGFRPPSKQKIDLNNFLEMKKLTSAEADLSDETNLTAFGNALINSSRKGIIRNVELMLPIAIFHNLKSIINNSLYLAAKYAHTTVLTVFIEYKVDIHFEDDRPLFEAVMSGHMEPVQYLLANGANVHARNNQLLLHCCQSGDYPETLQLLIQHGIKFNSYYSQLMNMCLDKNYSQTGQMLIQAIEKESCNEESKLDSAKTEYL